MQKQLVEYEKHLLERDVGANTSTMLKKSINVDLRKFKKAGEIIPYFGLTCIAWIDPQKVLFKELLAYQNALKSEFEKAGADKFFFFLDPNSFHMTLADIIARPVPIQSAKAQQYIDQITNAFSNDSNLESITGHVHGVGIKSTISALVRFDEEKELQKVVNLEKKIKDAAKVDIRIFSGHVALAYCVSHPGEALPAIRDILLSNKPPMFGELTFSNFDLVCFTDMNNYFPLLTINFAENHISRHPKLPDFRWAK